MKVINCLDNAKWKQMITLNSHETNLHVLPMGHLNIKVNDLLFLLFYVQLQLFSYLSLNNSKGLRSAPCQASFIQAFNW